VSEHQTSTYDIGSQEARDILAGLTESVVFAKPQQPYVSRLRSTLQKHGELVRRVGAEHAPQAHLKAHEVPLAITALKYRIRGLLPPFREPIPAERVIALLDTEGALERLQDVAPHVSSTPDESPTGLTTQE